MDSFAATVGSAWAGQKAAFWLLNRVGNYEHWTRSLGIAAGLWATARVLVVPPAAKPLVLGGGLGVFCASLGIKLVPVAPSLVVALAAGTTVVGCFFTRNVERLRRDNRFKIYILLSVLAPVGFLIIREFRYVPISRDVKQCIVAAHALSVACVCSLLYPAFPDMNNGLLDMLCYTLIRLVHDSY